MAVSHNIVLARVKKIDVLRGIGMVAVIFIHSLVFFLSNPVAYFMWDTSQFAVQLFVFCSSYLFFVKASPHSFPLLPYLLKRWSRLLFPYYIFIIIYFFSLFFLAKQTLTFSFIIQSLTLVGGVDINWLVLLFLELSVLFYIVQSLRFKNRFLLYMFGSVSFISCFYLLFFTFPLNYKFIMWLPWSTVIFFTLIYLKFKERRIFWYGGFTTLTLAYLVLRFSPFGLHHSFKMYDNKYPPNILFLSYGFIFILFFILIARKKFFSFPPLSKAITFFSVNSYSLYFIHYLVIFYVTHLYTKYPYLGWYGFFIGVLSISVVIQKILNIFIAEIKDRRVTFSLR